MIRRLGGMFQGVGGFSGSWEIGVTRGGLGVILHGHFN